MMLATKQKRQIQMSLPLKDIKKGKEAKEYGGEKHAKRHKRKTARPFDPSKKLHITMRSKKAINEHSMLHTKRIKIIKNIVFRAAQRHNVVIEKYVSVGNHLHLLIYTKSRRYFIARPHLRAFLREVSGLIARVITGAKKGMPAKERFWDYLAWSRVVEFGKDLKHIYKYFAKNWQDAFNVLDQWDWLEVGDFATGPPVV